MSSKLNENTIAHLRTTRLAVSPDESAAMLGVSRDYFDEHVAPELRIVRRGRRRLVPVRELERWLDAEAALAVRREQPER